MLKSLSEKDNPAEISYVDNVLIIAIMKEQCLECTRTVLLIVERTGFEINPGKAQLCQTEVKNLGLNLSTKGRCPDAQHVELI